MKKPAKLLPRRGKPTNQPDQMRSRRPLQRAAIRPGFAMKHRAGAPLDLFETSHTKAADMVLSLSLAPALECSGALDHVGELYHGIRELFSEFVYQFLADEQAGLDMYGQLDARRLH